MSHCGKITIALLVLSGYLGIYKNSLAIFYNDRNTPQITSRSVSIYPEIDRKALEAGIPFSDAESLSKLLEDFLS